MSAFLHRMSFAGSLGRTRATTAGGGPVNEDGIADPLAGAARRLHAD